MALPTDHGWAAWRCQTPSPSPGQPLCLPGSLAPLLRDWEEAAAEASPGVQRRRAFAGLCQLRAQPWRCRGPRGMVSGMGAACQAARSCSASSGKALQCCVSGVTAHSPRSPSAFQSRLHMLVAMLPQGLLASPPAARLAGMAGQCGGGGMWIPPSLGSLGIPAVEGWVSGPPVWLDQPPSPTLPEPLVGPRQGPCSHLGSGRWQWESRKAMCEG